MKLIAWLFCILVIIVFPGETTLGRIIITIAGIAAIAIILVDVFQYHRKQNSDDQNTRNVY